MLIAKCPIICYSAGVALVTATWLVSSTFGIPIRKLIADPAQITGTPFYTGFLSNLTIITWAAGAYVALFAAWVLKGLDADVEWLRFFRMAGIVTLVLMLDDLFMFHEEIFPHYLFVPSVTGIEPNEKFIIGLYGISILWFLYSSRHTIRKTDWHLLIVACAILAFGVFTDRGIAKKVFTDSAVRAFIEDASKFLGVLGWSVYYYTAARSVISMHLPQEESLSVPEVTSAIDSPAEPALIPTASQ